MNGLGSGELARDRQRETEGIARSERYRRAARSVRRAERAETNARQAADTARLATDRLATARQ